MIDEPDRLAVAMAGELGEHRGRPTAEQCAEWLDGLGEDDTWTVVSRLPYRRLTHLLLHRDDDGGIDVVRHHPSGATMTTVEDMAAAARLAVDWARDAPGRDAGITWAAMDPTPAEQLSELEAAIRTEIDQGYSDFDEISESATEVLDEPDEVEQHHVDAILVALWHTRLAEQATWPDRTDPDRVTDAFAALTADGITAMEHFACCLRCGTGEIGAESRPGDTGYVFFHYQDTERAVFDGELMVAFGSHDGDREVTAEVGRRAVAALTEQGLTVQWDGDVSRRIAVTGLTWRKRLEDT